MSRAVEIQVFKFSELSPAAQENARNWYRDNIEFNGEFVIEDASNVAAILGIEFDTRPVKTMSGHTIHKPCVYFSGFCSQGDGASFEGRYSYAKGAAKAIRDYAPNDKTLYYIADELQAIQSKAFYGFSATISQSGHYYHANTMSVTVEHSTHDERVTVDIENAIQELMRGFANWIYNQLETEYNYQMSDSIVDEMMIANEYEFEETGAIY